MNNKGQTTAMVILFALFFFILGSLFLNFFPSLVDSARVSLSCTDNTISDGSKLACLGGDLVLPYFILAIVSTAGGVIVSRLTI